MTLVRFLKSPTAAPYFLAYNIGDLADLEDAVAADLVIQGIAERVQTPAANPAKTAEKATSKQAAGAEQR